MISPETQRIDVFQMLPEGKLAPQALYFDDQQRPIHRVYSEEQELRARYGETYWLQRPGGSEVDLTRYAEVVSRIASLCGLRVDDEREGRIVQNIMHGLNAVGEAEQGMRHPNYNKGLDEASRIMSLTLEAAREEEHWRNKSYYDELTGILNSRGLNSAVASRFGLQKPPALEVLQEDPDITDPEGHLEALRNRELDAPVDMTLFFIDEANFKRLNSFGQHMGDAGLRCAVREIKSTLRAEDAATFGRLGGDEFLILFADMQDEDARSLQRRINGLQLEKIRPRRGEDLSPYDAAWKAIFDRRDALIEEARLQNEKPEIHASVVMHGEGEDRSEWFCINDQPMAPLRHVVVQALGRHEVTVNSWAQYEEALKGSELVMQGAKDIIHDSIGADRPSASKVKRQPPTRKTDKNKSHVG